LQRALTRSVTEWHRTRPANPQSHCCDCRAIRPTAGVAALSGSTQRDAQAVKANERAVAAIRESLNTRGEWVHDCGEMCYWDFCQVEPHNVSLCEYMTHLQLQKVENKSASASSHAWRRPDVSSASCASLANGAERCLDIKHGLGRRRHEARVEELLSPSCRLWGQLYLKKHREHPGRKTDNYVL
jgi:hypothetical protein